MPHRRDAAMAGGRADAAGGPAPVLAPRGLPWLLAACSALVALGYAGAASAPFVADDYTLICGLGDGSTGLDAIGMRRGTPFLRPLLGASFAADYHLFGPQPVAMHVHNFILHALAAWLLGVTAMVWTRLAAAGWVAALGFASFPLHPESVTWISARGYPLAGCFTLLMLCSVLRAAPGPVWKVLTYSGVLGAGALLSVEPALPLAAYPLALAWAVGAWRRGAAVSAVLVAVTIAYFVLRIAWLGGLGGYRTPEGVSRHEGFELVRTLTYVVQAWGHLLAPGPWDGADGWVVSAVVGGVAACGACLLGLARHGRASVAPGVALVVCVLAALTVTATWATLGRDLSGTRYLYFASMFWCVGIGWSAALALRAGGARRVAALAATAGLLVGQVFVLRAVNARWAQSGTLARAAIDGVAERVRVHGTRHVFLFDPPREHRGAHALPWGIEEALRVAVGPGLRVDVLRDAAAFATVKSVHAATPRAEREAIDVGEWDAGATSWRWQ